MIVYQARINKGNRVYKLTVEVTERVTLHYLQLGRTQTDDNKDRQRFVMFEKKLEFDTFKDINRGDLPLKIITDKFYSEFMEGVNNA
ncbi:hypothetical protein ACSZN3_21570 [Aeromonas hydrophila]|uniref:hypothetical protein n=1 Tax=Aeromonas hydrophila TaxID=644 RepID=UPI003EC8304B